MKVQSPPSLGAVSLSPLADSASLFGAIKLTTKPNPRVATGAKNLMQAVSSAGVALEHISPQAKAYESLLNNTTHSELPMVPTLARCDSADLSFKVPMLKQPQAKVTQSDVSFINLMNARVAAPKGLAAPLGQSLIISGHGDYNPKQRCPTFEIPQGTNVTVWAVHGQILRNDVGNIIETHRHQGQNLFSQTYDAGDHMPNYTVHPSADLALQGSPLTVAGKTQLNELVMPMQGRVHLATCLVVAQSFTR